MRERIEAIPDGTLRVRARHRRVPPTRAPPCERSLIRGCDAYVDYSGTSPQTVKPRSTASSTSHSAPACTRSSARLVPTIPNNEGLFRPVHVSAPEGCILNTTFPHPVNARAKTTNNINQVLFGALWPAFGEHAQAGAGSIWPFSVSGYDPEHGRFSVHVLPHGGRGAMRDMDGLVPIAFPHNSSVTPVEIWEAQCPVMILQQGAVA